MKISKLFHWLYAIVMLLPIFAIGVTCAYVIFNKNAYQSYADNSAENTFIFNTQNIDINKEYYLTNGYKNTLDEIDGNASNNMIYINIIEVINNPSDINFTNVNRIGFYSPQGTSYNIGFYLSYSDGTSTVNLSSGNTWQVKVQIVSWTNNFSNSLSKMNILSQNGSDNSLSNVFYYSINKVEQSQLFSWSYDSFLATPITYISDLFGIASNSPVILLMSYWLAISIIWLVFDLVMYMPLLVHRWLDKGVLE